MVITSHAGHNPDGKIACGAVGLIKESTEARNVNTKVISLLKAADYTAYDCTVDDGTSQSDVLAKIVAKCNAIINTELNISIHFNAGASDLTGNGVTTGTEVYVYSPASPAKSYAEAICKRISELGYKNRGVKYSTSLAVLKNTNKPTLLVECCFVDDADDIRLYNADIMARAIAQGILDVAGGAIKEENITTGEWLRAADGVRWWYRFNGDNNNYAKGDFYNINGYRYLFDEDGYMLTGLVLWNGERYLLAPEQNSNEGKLMKTTDSKGYAVEFVTVDSAFKKG